MTDEQFEKIKKGLNFHSEGGVYNLCTLTETTLRTIIEDAVKFYEKQQKIDALHIMELQKQNAELKDDNKVMADNYSKMEQKFYDNLTKAKELLKQWLQTSKASGCDNINIVSDTEQFLSEVEK